MTSNMKEALLVFMFFFGAPVIILAVIMMQGSTASGYSDCSVSYHDTNDDPNDGIYGSDYTCDDGSEQPENDTPVYR